VRARELSLATIPPEDPAVYEMIQKSDTMGVFQIESRAQMAMLPRLKPASFYDLVIEVAIVRPGPIQGQMVHPYLRRRAGTEPVDFPDDRIRGVLEKTLGVPLFQEQAMKLAMIAAGFTPGEADQLRRAMGAWRRSGVMDRFRQKLLDGMAANGYRAEFAERLFNQIRGFGEYGFPESHAASFALIAYASSYLKCHHPAAFYAAMLNCYPLGFYHPATLVKDAQRHGVNVRPIDVTRSDWRCTIEKSGAALAMRMGLKYVMGLREETGLRIEHERSVRPFGSIADMVRRTAPNRRELDTLAYAGALSAFGKTRRESLWQASAIERDAGSLFAGVDPPPSQSRLPAMAPIEETRADYATMGLTTGPHVMAHLRPRLKARGILSAADLEAARDGAIVQVAGLVIVRQRPGTAKGFFFITLEDETGVSNIIVLPDLFQQNRPLLHRAPILMVEGILQKRDGTIGIRGRRFAEIKLDSPLPSPHDFH
jgi:error-prone DNA polymerase